MYIWLSWAFFGFQAHICKNAFSWSIFVLGLVHLIPNNQANIRNEVKPLLISDSSACSPSLLLHLSFIGARLHEILSNKLCLLNDTSALGTMEQQPPDVRTSYFRHKGVSVNVTSFCSIHPQTHTHTEPVFSLAPSCRGLE